jgi:hypothetical protein
MEKKKTLEASDKAILLTPKGTLTIGEEYSSPSISFYKNNEVEDVVTIKYSKFMYKGEEVKDLQTIYDIIKSLTSIELPSDEEINEKANSLQDEKDGALYNEGINEGFYLGVEYMKEQILNQKKEPMNNETGNPIFKTTNDDIINSRIIYIKTQNTDPIFRVSTEYDKLSTDEKIEMLDSLNTWVNDEIMSILKEKYKNK